MGKGWKNEKNNYVSQWTKMRRERTWCESIKDLKSHIHLKREQVANNEFCVEIKLDKLIYCCSLHFD